MLKNIFVLLLPFFLSPGLHAQDIVTADTFSTRYLDSGSFTKQKLAAVNERIKKVAAENAKKNEASKRRGILIALGCLILFSLLALAFRIVNRK
jgi:hypothetical protein